MFPISKLNNGLMVLNTTPKRMIFSDKNYINGARKEDVDTIQVSKKMDIFHPIPSKPNYKAMKIGWVFKDDSFLHLQEVVEQADVIIVSKRVINALIQLGVRDRFPNVVSISYTKDTFSLPISEQEVDIERWVY